MSESLPPLSTSSTANGGDARNHDPNQVSTGNRTAQAEPVDPPVPAWCTGVSLIDVTALPSPTKPDFDDSASASRRGGRTRSRAAAAAAAAATAANANAVEQGEPISSLCLMHLGWRPREQANTDMNGFRSADVPTSPHPPSWFVPDRVAAVEREYLNQLQARDGFLISDSEYLTIRSHLVENVASRTGVEGESAPWPTSRANSTLLADSTPPTSLPAATLVSILHFLELHMVVCPSSVVPIADDPKWMPDSWWPQFDLDAVVPFFAARPICHSCSTMVADTPHYRSMVVPDRFLCSACFTSGQFDGLFSGTYVHIDAPTSPSTNGNNDAETDPNGPTWTDEELLRLLDAVGHFDPGLDDWDAVASYVNTEKSAADCLARFLTLQGDEARDLIAEQNFHDLPFLTAGNPVMATVEFLLHGVNPGVAAAFGQACLAQIAGLANDDGAIPEDADYAPVLKAGYQAAALQAAELAEIQDQQCRATVVQVVDLTVQRMEHKSRLITEMDAWVANETKARHQEYAGALDETRTVRDRVDKMRGQAGVAAAAASVTQPRRASSTVSASSEGAGVATTIPAYQGSGSLALSRMLHGGDASRPR
ncbi:hypothetical protein AMAG_19601 [Allomyces macrogynus ATCC 38327]|uniref:Uncharacterized protein n=1 Tax=Allomyces macrogynus (strain ATCC 38327) TaxID=578462 RepID=A0A0L0SVV0_ALLM3|nr:hypothetical protein AMAG_19601 [Allomyces macrogynus ATCC 38327]|eukprot:KNE66601.1 hypothetical protein AMAG_19601 [Allomyces macrogynus ATCC 38327]